MIASFEVEADWQVLIKQNPGFGQNYLKACAMIDVLTGMIKIKLIKKN